MRRTALYICIGLLSLSCQPKAYKATNKVYKQQAKTYAKLISQTHFTDTLSVPQPGEWVGTTNFSLRKPNYVIIHHTAQHSCEQTLQTFTKPRTQVSAHYVICKDGTVHHMLNDYLRAWHAGRGQWGSLTDVNSASVGIEIDNNGFEAFTPEQMESLEKLLAYLKEAYKIPKANFIGHADIAPTRKNDPNVLFDWASLSEKGFGNWYADTSGVEVPEYFELLPALKMIGYDTRDSLAVLQTVKRKYLAREDADSLSQSDMKVFYSLWQESMK
ncbi:N-acetylmuramoyl-L-alanine amidase [Jiulongibacter sp. NS-SX5]|uniref:N-acetylmuramoyl-L-alanine amidase n=1 Tax=Jiulongibacter sp. NS-SX5 TaxID=3463854 RepID=UPI00405829ED